VLIVVRRVSRYICTYGPLEQMMTQHASQKEYETARELQVRAMLAGWKGKPPGSRWPTATPKTMEAFQSRHSVLKTFSKSYMERQQHTLFLLDVDPASRFEVFEKECYERQLKPTTAESVWISFLAILKFMDPDQIGSTWIKRATKVMQGRAIACPVDFPLPMNDDHFKEIAEIFDKDLPDMVTILGFAYAMGQRLSDMLQLTADGVDRTKMEGVEYLTVTVRFGKTMQRRQPFTLPMRWTTWPAQRLFDLSRRAMRRGQIFLLSGSNSAEEREQLSRTCRMMMAAVSDDLEMRSPRRGGIQRMASNGIPPETIIKFSHHADQQMLMRYLDWGKVSSTRLHEMADVTHTLPVMNMLTPEVSIPSRA
jgi:hypothetical protein